MPTGCGPVDDLLGGGFERGTVTQLYGPPASGKTNLALSAAVRIAAAGDRALVLDTEGLSGERFRQLAHGALADDGTSGRVEDAAVEALAGRVVVTDAHDLAEQEAAVSDAAEFAPRVELIVLDSATGFYRLEREAGDEGETLRRVGRQVTELLSLARRHDLAVVVTNQVFTEIDGDQPRALGGHTLTHWTGIVLRLDRFRGGNRRATLEKHRSREAGETATFRITETGLAAAERTP